MDHLDTVSIDRITGEVTLNGSPVDSLKIAESSFVERYRIGKQAGEAPVRKLVAVDADVPCKIVVELLPKAIPLVELCENEVLESPIMTDLGSESDGVEDNVQTELGPDEDTGPESEESGVGWSDEAGESCEGDALSTSTETACPVEEEERS